MKSLNILLIAFLFFNFSHGQEKFITKQGYASFFSQSPLEDIKADNNQVLSIIDVSTGDIGIAILMKSFMFEKSLMQEHFNENYVESDKYPKATFKGQILNFKEIDPEESMVTVEGDLTIHGVSKPIQTQAKMVRTEKNTKLNGSFSVDVKDFDIKIPAVVANNIAKTIEVTFELDHQPYK